MQVVMAVGLALVASGLPAPSPEPYWQQIEGCSSGHTKYVARSKLRRLLKNDRPLSSHIHERVRHYRRCTLTREARKAVTAFARRLRRWRLDYAHVWPIRFARLPAWLQSWAWSTGACESGNNPTTSTGNGFYGAFQWVPSTWWAAGGDRWPTLASWHHQAVLAVRFMLRYGDEHWPNCGD